MRPWHSGRVDALFLPELPFGAPDAAHAEHRLFEADLCWTDGSRSVVRCELLTGRTHQIRVHLAARGWPILGDEVYGVPAEGLTRQALHAWRVRLPHPRTAEWLDFEAPVPRELAAPLTGDLLRTLRCRRT